MSATVTLRHAKEDDLDAVLAVERAAFGEDDEAELVRALLGDESAKPIVSMLAVAAREPVGHVLFTRARLSDSSIEALILAPLAVAPDLQQLGIGAALTRQGLAEARHMGMQLVFVLGHPSYYPRFGFEPALPHGLEPPYPIPPEAHDAWMVKELREGALDAATGTVTPADSLMRPEYWRE
jgi:putative acetyltransferase